MFFKLLFFVCLVFSVYGERISESKRSELALKMHRGFCLQSAGQSGSAFFAFNEGYQEALQLGISRRKLSAIWNLFTWYRKFGHYLGLFETTGQNIIIDAYQSERSKFANNLFASRSDSERIENLKKVREKYKFEIAEIARDTVFGCGEVIGGLLGAAFLPELRAKGVSLAIATHGGWKIYDGISRLITKNLIILEETKEIMKGIENAASNYNDQEWWLN